MIYRLFFACILFLSMVHSLSAQIPIMTKGYMMYANVIVSHKGTSHIVQTLIDTGSTVCFIDSTFAVDSCNIKVAENNATIGNTSGKRINSFRAELDSISLGGISFYKVCCYLIDFVGKFQHKAPKFVLGGDILKRELWCFDLKNSLMTQCTSPIKDIKTILKWRNHEDHSDAFLNSIYFNGKIAGKKSRILFDTGSQFNKLSQNFVITATKEIEIESGNIAEKLAMKKGRLCEDVCMEIDKNNFILDFVVNQDKYPRINASFLKERSFVLDYPNKKLYIIE